MTSIDDNLKAIEYRLKVNPNDAQAWNSKGVLLAKKEEFGDALRSFDVAIRLNPELAQAHSNRGRVLLALGADKAHDALKSFEVALRLSPMDPTMIRDKALALRSLGRTEEELACYKAISDHFADEWSFWIRMGDIQLELGQFESAVSSFDKALDIDSKLVPALVHRSIALSMQDNWKDAIKSANTATKLAPNDIEAWLVLGDANLRAGKHRSAMKALKQASKLDPSDPSVENTMGMASYKAGRLHDAVMHFEKALVRKKDHVSALRNLALVSMEMEAWEKASDVWTRFTSIVKTDPDAFDAQATASARLDDFCTAAEAWERARKLYKKQGNTAEAERVTTLGRAARINCSRQKKTARSQKKKERSLRRFGDRFEIRRKKQKGQR